MLTSYKQAFSIQFLHAILCIIWNAIALWQIHIEVQPIGPTASLIVIFGFSIIVFCLAFCLSKGYEKSYLLISFVIFLLATSAIYGGFTKPLNSWPSSFWQFAGIAVNTIGLLGFLLAARAFNSNR